jgi:hypothetical protein
MAKMRPLPADPQNQINIRYYGVDEFGNPSDPNPLYMHATSFFPPMSGRLGLEINF